MNRIPNLLVRQILLLLLIFSLGGALFFTLHPYLPALLGAYTLYVLLRPTMDHLTEKKNWNKVFAALLLILLSIVTIGVPLYFLVQLVHDRLITAIQHSPDVFNTLEALVKRLEIEYNINLLAAENLKDLANWAGSELRMLITATMDGIITTLIAMFILFFMLINGQQMETFFFNWLPFRHANVLDFKNQLNTLVFSNAVGIPCMGILQGLSGLPVYWLLGVPDVWLWFAVTCIAGMLPIVGVALAYIPLTVLMIANGMPWNGLLLFLYGFIVMGSVDNIGRMWLQKKLGDTHPLITLFGVIAGIKLFGFIGFVFGPILIALFLLIIRIYLREFGKEGHAAM